MAVILLFALAYAIHGALTEGWSGVKTAVGSGRVRTQSAGGPRPQQQTATGARVGAAVKVGSWLGEFFEMLRRVDASLAAGWRQGWQRGQEKGRNYISGVEQKRAAAQQGCEKCGHGSVKVPSQRDCGCPADGCLCSNVTQQVVSRGGGAVGQCASCSHLYRQGRVAGCQCGNDRCPCYVVGAQQSSSIPPIPAPTN